MDISIRTRRRITTRLETLPITHEPPHGTVCFSFPSTSNDFLQRENTIDVPYGKEQ